MGLQGVAEDTGQERLQHPVVVLLAPVPDAVDHPAEHPPERAGHHLADRREHGVAAAEGGIEIGEGRHGQDVAHAQGLRGVHPGQGEGRALEQQVGEPVAIFALLACAQRRPQLGLPVAVVFVVVFIERVQDHRHHRPEQRGAREADRAADRRPVREDEPHRPEAGDPLGLGGPLERAVELARDHRRHDQLELAELENDPSRVAERHERRRGVVGRVVTVAVVDYVERELARGVLRHAVGPTAPVGGDPRHGAVHHLDALRHHAQEPIRFIPHGGQYAVAVQLPAAQLQGEPGVQAAALGQVLEQVAHISRGLLEVDPVGQAGVLGHGREVRVGFADLSGGPAVADPRRDQRLGPHHGLGGVHGVVVWRQQQGV